MQTLALFHTPLFTSSDTSSAARFFFVIWSHSKKVKHFQRPSGAIFFLSRGKVLNEKCCSCYKAYVCLLKRGSVDCSISPLQSGILLFYLEFRIWYYKRLWRAGAVHHHIPCLHIHHSIPITLTLLSCPNSTPDTQLTIPARHLSNHRPSFWKAEI